MIISVKRQTGPESESYIQKFDYEGGARESVAHILEELNKRDELKDIEGKEARKIDWECSCLQKMCGACAMVIDGIPALACSTFVDAGSERELVLEPLSKFPVISDLMVDRNIIMEHLKQAAMYLGEKSEYNKREYSDQYAAAKCLKCGICLEVCPNYVGGSGRFHGAVMANDAYLLYSTSENRKKDISREYKLHFGRGCSKSLLCRDLCPAKIPTLSAISYMNRK